MRTFDEDLIRLCRAGKVEAFDALMLRWQGKILNLAYHYLGNADDAHDVCQDVFLRAFRKLDTYALGTSFSAWLYRIALNRCTDVVRRRRVRERTVARGNDYEPALADENELPDGAPSPFEHAERSEVAELVGRALQGLPEEQRAPIVMRHYLGLSFPEIAETLGCPATTIKSRVYAGFATLKRTLSRMGLLEGSAAR